jgi:Do/DeqQ family serine protease
MNMKNLGFTALVAVVSTLITVAAIRYVSKNEPVTFEEKQAAYFEQVNYTAAEVPAGLDFRYPARITTPAVVHITTSYAPRSSSSRDQYNPFRDFFGDDFFNPYGQQPQQSSGSGVIISDDGYIVTNNHVIDRGEKIQVILANKKSFEATLIGTDPSTDIALIKIEERGLPFIRFANSDSVEVGEWVLAVGNPFNLESTVTAGIVSAKGRNINILRSRDNSAVEAFIQTDAAVNPGNSGGALVDLRGQLIGINTAIATPTGTFAGYSFAVPVNLVSKVVNDLMKYGMVQRGYLGIQIATVTDELAKREGLNNLSGVYVDSVNAGSSAEDAGIKSGDVILKINDAAVNSSPELQEQVSRYHPGDKITVTFERNGKVKTVSAILKNKEGNTEYVKKEEAYMIDALGADFADLTAQEKKEMGLTGGVKVVKIKDGKLRQSTYMKEGFIITKVDNRAINNLSDLKSAFANKKDGGVMIEGRYPNEPGQFFYAFGL